MANLKIECDGFTLEVVKLSGSVVRWAQKATITHSKESRYRGYRYKKEAEIGLHEWQEYQPLMMFMREFYHNFTTAEDLNITEDIKQ